MLLQFYVLDFWVCGFQDLSSPQGSNSNPMCWKAKSQLLDHLDWATWEIPLAAVFSSFI